MYDNDYGFVTTGANTTNNNSDGIDSTKTENAATTQAVNTTVQTGTESTADVTGGSTQTVETAGTETETQNTGNTYGTTGSTTQPSPTVSNPRYTDLTAGGSASNAGNGYYSSGGTGFSGYANGGYDRSYGQGTGSTYGTTGSNYGGNSGGRSYTNTAAGSTYGNAYSRTPGNAYGSNSGSSSYTGSAAGSTYGSAGTGSSYGTTGTAYGTGYGSTSNGPDNNTGYNRYGYSPEEHKKSRKKAKGEKKGRFGMVLGAAAILMAGILGGSAISYSYLNSRMTALEESVNKQAASNKNNAGTTTVQDRIELNKGNKQDDVKDGAANTVVGSSAGYNMDVSDVVEANLSSVVAITNYGVTEIRSMWGNFTQESKSAGSGVIIAETDDELLILTNYHVVEDNRTLSVVFSWDEYDEKEADNADIITATVKDYDESRDIAVIAIDINDLSKDTLDQITLAPIGDSDALELGEQVVAIGNALGYGQSVTTGIVSALNRQIGATDSYGNTDNNTYIQTDAAINPGNSGGALFNMNGELVGINSAKIGGSQVDSVGYAIPISDIMEEVENMMNQETRETVELGQRGYLGVSIMNVTEEISMTYGLPVGIYVSSVETGSGAEKAGIKKEDVITGINGKSVTSSTDLKDYLSKYSAGETVTVTVAQASNNYEEKDIEVTLGSDPNMTTN